MRNRLRRATRGLRSAERAFLAGSSAWPRSAADRGLRRLTVLADHGKLWFALAGVLATRKGPWRRAALRGAAAVAISSAVTNGLGKRLLPRRRPAVHLLPRHRRLRTPPSSSSFPSGHAASAAAFTSAVSMEAPLLGLALAPLAGTVAYSRVHTGVHWPSDVVFGMALGAGVAMATSRWWPVRAAPALARPSPGAAALPTGDGLLLLVNPSSGARDPSAELAARWPNAELLHPVPGEGLVEQLDAHLDGGRDVAALGVAGGDGSVAAAAEVAATRGLPLLPVPTGTLNHFTRDLGVSGPRDAAGALAAGSAVQVDLGAVRVDGGPTHRFVNTAGIGGYPELVRLREKWQHRWGKWPAAVLALARALAEAEPVPVRIDGLPHRVWLLFVGNNTYQPKGLAPSWRPRLDEGLLDLRYIRADVPLSRTRFLAGALTGALTRNHAYVQRERERVRVEVLGSPAPLAADGELVGSGRTFDFSARRAELRAYRPERTSRVTARAPRAGTRRLPALPWGRARAAARRGP
ncbi:bifunctional phosphatase PAP2/diacylglycerol kinase family protein [Saccharopolyspora griseoalba]|uniref:Bifunctional phosphatase PAP2/diacylglycerol kinase family protein n=1 Tax=Saccharopolyspora griseoalba TaxID=1431848 RepID=A0ABW2LS57_9PSEU